MKMTRLKLTAALCSLTMLSGCGIFSADDPHAPHELTDITPKVDAHVQWRVNVGDAASRTLVPAVYENAVYAAGGDEVVRLDAETGKVVWRVKTKAPVTAGVGTDGHYVAVGTAAGELEVFDAEGRFLWRATLTSDIAVPPLVGMGLVVARTSDTRITGFGADKGEQRWYYLGQVPSLTVNTFNALAWSPAGILSGQANGRLLALSPEGKTVFDAVIGQPKGITEVERLIDVVGRPWVDGELMCAGAFQGNLVCMQSMNGRLAWSVKLDAMSGPVSDNLAVYITDARSRVHAFNRKNGREAWVNEELLYRNVSAPVRIGGVVAVGDLEGVVTMMDPTNGDIVGRTKLSGAITSPATQLNYGAVFQTVEGDVAYVLQEPLTH